MENGDLKRYYKVNNQDAKDFVRLNADGKVDKDLLPDDVGTEVVANPTGTATDDLTKLQVGETIYAIPTGGDTTYNPFPAGWTTTGTIAQFCAAVNADSTAVEGMAYLGELRCSDLPTGLANVEAVVEVIDGTGTSNKVIHIMITSGNVSPYRWEYTYWNNGTNVSGWKTWLSTEGGSVTGAIELGTTGSITQNGKAVIQANQYNSNVNIGDFTNGREIYLCAPQGLWRAVNGNTNYRILDTSTGLQLTGGTMTGQIKIGVNSSIGTSDNLTLLSTDSNGNTYLGSLSKTTTLYSQYGMSIRRANGVTTVNILDADNTSANPGSTTATLTSLKLNNVNYAIAGGTQVTFVDWS